MYRTLTLENQEGIFTLILNQPHNRNALSYEMAEEFERAIAQLTQEQQARGLILTGRGRAFCAGEISTVSFQSSPGRQWNCSPG